MAKPQERAHKENVSQERVVVKVREGGREVSFLHNLNSFSPLAHPLC